MAEVVKLLLTDTQRDPRTGDDTYDEYLREFVTRLKNMSTKKLTQKVDGVSILHLLDPSRNTLSYLSVLVAHQQNAGQLSDDELLIATASFLTSFDPIQARYAGSLWMSCLGWTASLIQQTNNTQLLPVLGTAILRMDPTAATFTTSHLIFVQSCLGLGLPRQALPILDKDIYSLPGVPTKDVDEVLLCANHELSCTYITKWSKISDEISLPNIQEYYLLGAHVYIGLRNYERARMCLEFVMAVPTKDNAANSYMMEAYKKLLILGLVASGEPYKTSHLTEQGSHKTLSSLCKAYESLVEAFRNRDLRRFYAEIDVAGDLWATDGNFGLVQAAAEALRRYRVIDLQRTYAAVDVDRVAIHLSLSSQATVQLLTTMIQDGHLNATIQDRSTSATTNGNASVILRFHSTSSTQRSGGSSTIDNAIETQVEKIKALSAFVKEADRRLAVTKEYADYVKRSKKADPGAAAFEDPMEMSWDPPADDEDLMAH